MLKKYDCLVIGAGASGMMAAIMAARSGKKIVVVDHKSEPGKKILQTGNGRCNYTNMNMHAGFYPEKMQNAVAEALERFGLEETLEFFRSVGIFPRQKNGYVYPYSETALSIRNALWYELKRLKVDIFTDTEVSELKKTSDFRMSLMRRSEDGKKVDISSEKLIIAAGSKASPKSGSDGSGYEFLSRLGIRYSEAYPALVKLSSPDKENKKAAGVRHTSRIGLFIDGCETASDMGEVQFVPDGISGIPVFQISRYVAPAIMEKRKVSAVLDLLPEFEIEKLIKDMTATKVRMGDRSLVNFWGGLLPSKLVTAVAGKASVSPDRKVRDISAEKMTEFIEHMKNYRVEINGTNGFDSAQVCSGGVSLDDIEISTMESRQVENLYLAGEILDVDGPCGGYNLQWAWTSGAIAGIAVGEMDDL